MTKATSIPRPQQRFKDAHGTIVTVESVIFNRVTFTATDITHHAYSRWNALPKNSGR